MANEVQTDSNAVVQTNSNGVVLLTTDAPTFPQVIDDFEDGNISEYGGSTGQYNVNTNSPVHNGSYSLKMPGTDAYYSISSTSGLDNYPSQGETFSIWAYVEDGGNDEIEFHFATQNEPSSGRPDGYNVVLNAFNSNFALYKVDGGSRTVLHTENQSFSTGVWYKVEVEWFSDDSITVTLYDASGSHVNRVGSHDTTFSSGGVGFTQWCFDGASVFDLYQIDGVAPDFIVVEDFEDSDLSEYNGDITEFGLSGSPVSHGSLALSLPSASAYEMIYSLSVPRQPKPGDTFKVDMYAEDGANDELAFHFGVQAPSSGTYPTGYGVELDGFNDTLEFYKYDGSSKTDLGTVSQTWNSGEWYTFEVEWTNTGINVSVYDSGGTLQTQTSTSDTTYTDGGIGFSHWVFNGGAAIDHFRIIP